MTLEILLEKWEPAEVARNNHQSEHNPSFQSHWASLPAGETGGCAMLIGNKTTQVRGDSGHLKQEPWSSALSCSTRPICEPQKKSINTLISSQPSRSTALMFKIKPLSWQTCPGLASALKDEDNLKWVMCFLCICWPQTTKDVWCHISHTCPQHMVIFKKCDILSSGVWLTCTSLYLLLLQALRASATFPSHHWLPKTTCTSEFMYNSEP